MGQPTLVGDRRARCHTCSAVLHTIQGKLRHYGSDAACKKIQELQRNVGKLREGLRQLRESVMDDSLSADDLTQFIDDLLAGVDDVETEAEAKA